MKINEIILGTVNEKGYERNFLCTFETFVKKYMPSACENYWEVAEIITELEKVKGKDNACCEMYFSPNETMYVRYCKSISDLELFITGRYNETECEFYYELCDEKCMEILDRLGISIKDEKIKRSYPHYEKIEREYEQGEILHNLNGSDYRVVEKLTDKDLLLMELKSGNYTVAIGVEYYARYPKKEDVNSELCEKGIEWGHGIYLGNTPSTIDFKLIREEYGKSRYMDESEPNEKLMYQVEIEERLARTIEVEAKSMDEATDIVNEQYYNEEIVLDAEDMKDVNLKVVGSRKLTREKLR